MTTQRTTIELPEDIFRQSVRIAEATHQPIEALVAQSVISNLPPLLIAPHQNYNQNSSECKPSILKN